MNDYNWEIRFIETDLSLDIGKLTLMSKLYGSFEASRSCRKSTNLCLFDFFFVIYSK